MRIWTIAFVSALLATGCDAPEEDDMMGGADDAAAVDDDDDDDDGADDISGMESELDEDAILDAALMYAQTMVRVSAEPRKSQHALADTVHFYVAPEYRELFESIDPDADDTALAPEGMLIVKENLDEGGTPSGFFAMYKAYEGYNPDSGDWYWLRVDADGMRADHGKVGFCAGCHAQVAESDFMFGVPLDNRN